MQIQRLDLTIKQIPIYRAQNERSLKGHLPKCGEVPLAFPSIELERLQQEVGIDDVELLVTVAQALAKEAPICLGNIENALADRKEQDLAIAAHALKGASRVMMMSTVAAVAQEVEMAGKRCDFDAVATHVATLRRHVNEMLQAIEQFVNDNQTR